MAGDEAKQTHGRLARNLYIAWAASRMRVSMGYYEKRYAPEDCEIGDFWCELAYVVSTYLTRAIDNEIDPEANQQDGLIQ